MRNSLKYIFLVVIILILSCNKEIESNFIDYPEFSNYGENILFPDKTYFPIQSGYSLAANLSDKTNLKIVLKGSEWYCQMSPDGPVNWNVSEYNLSNKSQTFTSIKSGKDCDLIMDFVVPEDSVIIEYYENNSELPTRTKTIKLMTEKDANDYRNKYCGDFSFNTIDWFYCINSGHSEYPTTYLGRIEKINDSDSLILITYKNGRNTRICSGDSVYGSYIIPKVDSKGKLYYKIKCAANSGFSGYFAGNDTVKIYNTGGGKGCNSGQIIIGIRQ